MIASPLILPPTPALCCCCVASRTTQQTIQPAGSWFWRRPHVRVNAQSHLPSEAPREPVVSLSPPQRVTMIRTHGCGTAPKCAKGLHHLVQMRHNYQKRRPRLPRVKVAGDQLLQRGVRTSLPSRKRTSSMQLLSQPVCAAALLRLCAANPHRFITLGTPLHCPSDNPMVGSMPLSTATLTSLITVCHGVHQQFDNQPVCWAALFRLCAVPKPNTQKSATHGKFIFSLHILLWSIVNNGRINFSSAKATRGVPVQLSLIC